MSYYSEDAPVKKGFTFWKLIKWLLALLTLTVYLLLTFRACALEHMEDTATTRKFLWNELTAAAYNSEPASFDISTYSPANYITSDGMFTITNIRYIPSAGQVQFTLRYNNSLARLIESDFSLYEEPTGEYVVYALRDDNGNVYTDYKYISDKVFVYNYRRLVFDGIDFSAVQTLSVEMYYSGYVDYGNTSAKLNTLPVYSAEVENKPYTLDKKELPAEPDDDMQSSLVWPQPIHETENVEETEQ